MTTRWWRNAVVAHAALLSLVLSPSSGDCVGAARADEPARYVIVPRSLPLHVAPAADARTVRVAAPEAGEWLRLRRVGDAGDGWLEVQTDPAGRDPIHREESGASHCHLSAYDGLALHFFVRQRALSAVTRRSFERRHRDQCEMPERQVD